ncbi:PTS sugar transporter subunit IIC [Enterococcus sp. HY326]|uniref:PTS sugar transporter subunit IIC n=1 Tax=Enterococcus sp. HY326 TaxID=2971265 RepID=UPI0022409BD7|nr:PTS transporter subunit EIIC [Enterococcus sp. HY326]
MSSSYEKFQDLIDQKVLPIASKFGANKIIQAISGGLMYTLPLTLGASIFSILGNFPIASVNAWFNEVGLTEHFNSLQGGTLNIIGLLIAFSIPYSYTKLLNKANTNPLMAAFISIASYITLMPQTVGEEQIAALSYDYLGSSGMFVAIVLGLIIAKMYVSLSQNKKLLIRMPEGVPPMVNQSFEPLVVAIIILISVVVLRIGLSYTPMENIFNLIQTFIGNPITKIGSSVPAIILIGMIANGLFFFGIHPNAINSALVPLLMNMALMNVAAFQAGEVLPYKDIMIVNSFLNNDAVGSTLSLLMAILLFCKSKRYRSFAKISAVPNLFNINEPVIFGMPIMLNPVLFIPFFLSTFITGIIGYLGSISGFISYYDPTLALGMASIWTVPKLISSFFIMGWQGLVLRIVSMAVMVVVYLPFIKTLDRQELIKEQGMENLTVSSLTSQQSQLKQS